MTSFELLESGDPRAADHRPKARAATTERLCLVSATIAKAYACAMNDNDPGNARSNRLTPAGWFAIVVLLGFLGWASWYAVNSWNALAGIDISVTGWVFIVFGVLLTLGLGGGLMALVFYSSRKDFDR
jgi:hypothetical protein